MRTRYTVLIAIVLFASYAYVLPRWADWSQNSRLDLVRALTEQHSVTIDAYVANTGDYALYQGHTYSDKAPGPVFLALPLALVLQPILDLPAVRAWSDQQARGPAFGSTLNSNGSGLNADKVRVFLLQIALTLWAISAPVTLSALALFAIVRRRLAHEPAALVVLAYGLATGVAPYAGNFYSHALVAALLVGAWYAASAPFAPARALLLGLLAGWSAISEYPAALPAALIIGAAIWCWRRPAALGWIVLGGLLPLLLLALYDWRAFGTPLPVGYEHSALWQTQHQSGLLSITYPRAEALWGLTFGLFRGLFVRAPWLLLAGPGYLIWWRERRARPWWWVALLAPLSMLLFYGSSVMWWGGFAAGPRYLVVAAPFLALASAPAVAWLWRRGWGRATLVALIGGSLILTWGEALAGQSFPSDAIANPWLDYTVPAWRSGDIARNLGMALRLHGPSSLIPLALLVVWGIVAIVRWPTGGLRLPAAKAPSVPTQET